MPKYLGSNIQKTRFEGIEVLTYVRWRCGDSLTAKIQITELEKKAVIMVILPGCKVDFATLIHCLQPVR